MVIQRIKDRVSFKKLKVLVIDEDNNIEVLEPNKIDVITNQIIHTYKNAFGVVDISGDIYGNHFVHSKLAYEFELSKNEFTKLYTRLKEDNIYVLKDGEIIKVLMSSLPKILQEKITVRLSEFNKVSTRLTIEEYADLIEELNRDIK